MGIPAKLIEIISGFVVKIGVDLWKSESSTNGAQIEGKKKKVNLWDKLDNNQYVLVYTRSILVGHTPGRGVNFVKEEVEGEDRVNT